MNKINIFSLGGVRTIVKRCADANLSFDAFFFHENELWSNAPTYHAIKVVIIGCIVRNPLFKSVFIAQLRSIEAVSYFSYCCFCLNELFSYCRKYVLKGPYEQYTPDIVFVLYCIALYFDVSCTTFFFPYVVFKIRVRLVVKIYSFTTLCWVNKDENTKPNKFTQPIGQYIAHSYWKQIHCLKLPFLRSNQQLFVRILTVE